MSTPRELLGIRDDLAKKVAEHQIDRNDAIADLRDAMRAYPEQQEKIEADWADVEIDRGVKKYIGRRNKAANAEITRKLAELGMERVTLDGRVDPISEDDPSYSSTLADYADYVSVNIASSWRLLKSFEVREENHEVLVAATGGTLSATREQAVDALKRMPEAKRKALRSEVRAKLSAERQAFTERRYGTGSQAAEG